MNRTPNILGRKAVSRSELEVRHDLRHPRCHLRRLALRLYARARPPDQPVVSHATTRCTAQLRVGRLPTEDSSSCVRGNSPPWGGGSGSCPFASQSRPPRRRRRSSSRSACRSRRLRNRGGVSVSFASAREWLSWRGGSVDYRECCDRAHCYHRGCLWPDRNAAGATGARGTSRFRRCPGTHDT